MNIEDDPDRLMLVIATYDEIESLPSLVADLFQQLPQLHILVVDDNSPDGTGDWCEQNRSEFPALHCIHRAGKFGLGSATMTGVQYALDQGFRYVATMDADYSHDPASLPLLLETIRKPENSRVAVVIGSRCVPGGKVEGWPVIRRFASKAVNLFARCWLGLKTRDNSGAFRIYSSAALENVGVENVSSGSYAYLEEILWRLQTAGYPALEVPIVFRNRKLGVTKMNWRLGLGVFLEILQMPRRGRTQANAEGLSNSS